MVVVSFFVGHRCCWNIPGLGEKFCNGPGTVFMCSPYHLFIFGTVKHRWELPGNYPVFAVVMVIYHYVERIWRIIVTPDFDITYTIMKNIIQVNQFIYIYNH